MTRDLTVEQSKIPASRQIKHSPVCHQLVLTYTTLWSPSHAQKTTKPTCSSQTSPGKRLLSPLTCTTTANTHMPQDCRQSPPKVLLNTFGMCCRTHTMARYRSFDIEDVLTTHDSAPLDLLLQEHPMPEGNNESSGEYWRNWHLSPLG